MKDTVAVIGGGKDPRVGGPTRTVVVEGGPDVGTSSPPPRLPVPEAR